MSNGDKNKVATKELKKQCKTKQNKNQKHTKMRHKATLEMARWGKMVADSSRQSSGHWPRGSNMERRWSNMERTDEDKREKRTKYQQN